MIFLLVGINAKYIHSNPAIYSLRAYAGEEFRENIELAEYTINNRKEEILADIYRRRPKILGFSCYIWNFSLVKELLEDISKVLPGIEVWLGGPEVSFDGPELLEAYPAVKGIMIGEGEETFRELLAYYRELLATDKTDTRVIKLNSIKGLLLREGKTGERTLLEMDELPFLYDKMEDFQNKIVYYESSRGCPFRCSYCLSAIDKSVRFRSMDKVKRELQFFLQEKVPQVKFIDRTFNSNHDHCMEIWKYIKENDNGVTNFHFEIAADIMTEEEIALLSELRPGLVQLEIGVQSTNETTLREINRFVNTKHIAKVVDALRQKENIHIHLDLIAGLPFEDYDSFVNSFDEVYAMKPEQLQLGFLKVLKGSPMEAKAVEYKIMYQKSAPYEVLSTKWLSYEQVLKLKKVEEMVELYYNSNQFRHMMPVLEQEFESAFKMYEALAEYYERKGYFVNVPARSSRYEVLLAFACEQNPAREGLYRELLTFDFYLREKAKSRPSYAGGVEEYREVIWEFYCREEEIPAYLEGYKEYHARQTMKMTHMEAFTYSVWEKEPEKVSTKLSEALFVLFDYKERNPLTGDAKYNIIHL